MKNRLEIGKVSIELPAKLVKELESKVNTVIEEWMVYKKPKFKESDYSGFGLIIDNSLNKRIESFVMSHPCGLCKKDIGQSFAIISQIALNRKEIIYIGICENCVKELQKPINQIKNNVDKKK